MLIQFKRMNKEERVKQTVSLRLSPSTLRKAKSLGNHGKVDMTECIR